MDSPITTECDALREEVAMLAAENRRLLNEVLELRKTPAYPEAAVRAVWEDGVGTMDHVQWSDYAERVSRVFTEALRDA